MGAGQSGLLAEGGVLAIRPGVKGHLALRQAGHIGSSEGHLDQAVHPVPRKVAQFGQHLGLAHGLPAGRIAVQQPGAVGRLAQGEGQELDLER